MPTNIAKPARWTIEQKCKVRCTHIPRSPTPSKTASRITRAPLFAPPVCSTLLNLRQATPMIARSLEKWSFKLRYEE